MSSIVHYNKLGRNSIRSRYRLRINLMNHERFPEEALCIMSPTQLLDAQIIADTTTR
jgi:hypothetical protein